MTWRKRREYHDARVNLLTGLGCDGINRSLAIGNALIGPTEPFERWLLRAQRQTFDQWCNEQYPMIGADTREIMFAAWLAGYDQRADEE